MKKLTFIHIGKCGGTTIRKLLKKNNIKFDEIHCWHSSHPQSSIKIKINYNDTAKYIICIRNPIKRFISALNWRYYKLLIKNKQKNKFLNEKYFLSYYNDINEICSDLKKNNNLFKGNENSGNYIHHIKQDIHYYLENLIKHLDNNNCIGFICTEILDDDFSKIFKLNNHNLEKKEKKNYNNKFNFDKIKNKNNKILKSYLKKDYEIIEKLYEKKLINKLQYSYLKL